MSWGPAPVLSQLCPDLGDTSLLTQTTSASPCTAPEQVAFDKSSFKKSFPGILMFKHHRTCLNWTYPPAPQCHLPLHFPVLKSATLRLPFQNLNVLFLSSSPFLSTHQAANTINSTSSIHFIGVQKSEGARDKQRNRNQIRPNPQWGARLPLRRHQDCFKESGDRYSTIMGRRIIFRQLAHKILWPEACHSLFQCLPSSLKASSPTRVMSVLK